MTDPLNPVPDSIHEAVCRARGCGAPAQWGLLWNNPKLHTPDRRKVWLACADHRAHLEEYLGTRGLLRGTVPVTELPVADLPDAGSPTAGDEPRLGGILGALRDRP
ncbi:hypothetical protein [Pengzhenrongella frigida]|uniref:hypothetical protein n=1 Tax=Pengzhenrongella frigida TaxID=1259133 RepID=UPI00331300EC